MPGSGKTTHAKRVAEELIGVRFSADEWMDQLRINLWDAPARDRIEKLQWSLAKQILTIGGTAIIEWGTWGRAERDLLRTEARALGAAVELHFLDEPLDVLFERIRNRSAETPPVTRNDLELWNEQIQRPTPDELKLFDPPSVATS